MLAFAVPLAATSAAPAEDASPLAAGVIAPGVSVAGVPVGGMTASQAQPWIQQAVLGEVTVTVGSLSWTVPTRQLGLHAYVARPLRVALAQGRTTAVTGEDIPVVTRITGNALRAFVRSLAPQVRVEPVDAAFHLVKSVPVVTPDRWGRQLDVVNATAAIAAALKHPDRGPVELPTKVVKPAVTARNLPPALVVDRTLHHVSLYSKHGVKLRTLGVAVGQSQYPDAGRAIRDHREAAQPLVVSAELGLGRGRASRAPRARQPAGHALDGHLGSRRRPARHARRGLGRLQRLARLHPHAHPGRRVAVRARARRQSRVDHSI